MQVAARCASTGAAAPSNAPRAASTRSSTVNNEMAASAAYHVNTVVIGAGCVGLAAARAIAATGRETIILERENAIGQGTSSRNSEVIHAGIYYPPQLQPLKARLCVRGKELLYSYCSDHNIPHQRIGKLIVATDESQLKTNLPAIMERAHTNGVTDLHLLSEDEVKGMEAEVVCHGAIFSPSTGIVDSHTLMLEFLGDAETRGASLALNSVVQNVAVANFGRNRGNLLVKTEEMTLSCDHLVNCAGLYADKISSMVYRSLTSDIDNKNDASPRQYFAKGNYYKLEGQKGPFSHLIYPVPEPGGLGVHATIDLGGSTRFGPDVEWLEGVETPDDIDLSVDPKRADSFYDAIRKYWPGLQDNGLVPDYAGIRPKSAPKGSSQASGDFVISGPKAHQIEGFIDLIGIESPGLTSSMAIAEEIVQIIEQGK